MELHEVFGPELDCSAKWYAVSSKMAEGKLQDYVKSDIFKIFPGEMLEVPKSSLVDELGARVKGKWFSSRKRDSVVVCTLFGILCRSIRRKKIDNDF